MDSLANGDEYVVTLLSIAELLYGLYLRPRTSANLAEWARIKPGLQIDNIAENDALRAAELRIALRRHGWQLEMVDALIAVAALRLDLTLLTTDRDFTPIPGLRQENWI